MHVNGIVNKER